MASRVLVLTPYIYGTTPGPRSSFELWEPVLRTADIHLDYAEFETPELHEVLHNKSATTATKIVALSRAYARFIPRLRNVGQYDAVLVNREATLIGPAVLERLIARRGTPLIYWIDDPLYIPYRSPSNGLFSYLKFFGKVKTLCRISQMVMTNSPSHTAFARRFNARVTEIPSLVDGAAYSGWQPRSGNGHVNVGWTGSPSTAPNLELIREPLVRLGERDDVRLQFIGAASFDLPGVRFESQPWRASSEVEDLRRFDIGLLPVPPSPWAPHKFYMKLVQYMALGIPTVASAIGSNPMVIEDGKTGLLVYDDADWERTITTLIDDKGLRQRIGQQAAEVAHRKYTVQANADKIIRTFQSALAGR